MIAKEAPCPKTRCEMLVSQDPQEVSYFRGEPRRHAHVRIVPGHGFDRQGTPPVLYGGVRGAINHRLTRARITSLSHALARPARHTDCNASLGQRRGVTR